MTKKNTPTTGQLLRSLDVILHEIMTMEETLRDAPRTVTDDDRRHLRRTITELQRRAEHVMNWRTEQRLEASKH